MDKTLEATELTVERILGDQACSYVIPSYQRPYSWTVDQVEQLWDDLITWIDGNPHSAIDNLPPYFLGSIVLTGGPAQFEVIDGQQRLTTISILLAAARSLATSDPMVKYLDRHLEGDVDPFKSNHHPLRLTARERDAEFWKSRIIRTGVNYAELSVEGGMEDSQRNMVANAKWLHARLSELEAQKRSRVIAALAKRCFLVVVKTRDTYAAMRIFQVLNDRGLDLRATDILKASILSLLGERARGDWTKVWEDAEADLGRHGLEALFAHLRMLIRRKRQETTLVKEMDDAIKAMGIDRFLSQELHGAIGAYIIVKNLDYEASVGAERVNDHLTALSLLDNQDWEPIALRLVQTLRQKPKELGDALQLLEAVAFRSLLQRDSVHTRLTMYIGIMEQVASGATWTAALNGAQRPDLLPGLLDGDLYTSTRARRPVLLLLNRLLSDDGLWVIEREVTVEHVLPQTVPARSSWSQTFEPHVHQRWLNRIGNLVLLNRRRNAAAGNKPFDEKKKKYFLTRGSSPYALTSQVLAEETWTPEVVARRHADLTGRLVQRWTAQTSTL